MPTLTLDQLVQWVQEIPPLPNVAVRVMRMADDPNVGPRDIAAVVSTDVALATRVLRIANSAYYGMARKVSTLNEAVLLLGLKAMRSLAVAAAAYDTLKNEAAGYNLASGELWRHSISCAVASQVIAQKTRKVQPEEAFVAGLLHDVGKVILSLYVAQQFQAILALVELEQIPFSEAERTVLGFDHAEVGARIAEKWNLPTPLVAAIGGHHSLQRGGDMPELAAVVHIANAVCLTEGMGLGADGLDEPLDPAALQLLNMTIPDVEVVLDELVEQFQRSAGLFETLRAA